MDDANRIGASRNVSRVRSVQGIREGLLPIDEALNYHFRPDELAYVNQLKQNYIDGDPDYVRGEIIQLAERYQTNDIGIVTICYSFEDRVNSYELVAQAFGLNSK